MFIFFLSLVVDPDRIFFTIPYLDHPVTWYGTLFALGFFLGYLIARRLFVRLISHDIQADQLRATATLLADRLSFFVMIATIVGARLGHVFFYDWPLYRHRLGDIIKIWEGGLASHGAAIGIVIALFAFVWWHRKKYPQLTLLAVLDIVVVAGAIACALIRVGNFLNQEILGKPTSLPWGMRFCHPLDGPANISVHPVQLYESGFYFIVFCVLILLIQFFAVELGKGLLAGIFFLSVFSFRFGIEYLKLPLSQIYDETSMINMGQLLSIPFIVLGLFLIVRYFLIAKKRECLARKK